MKQKKLTLKRKIAQCRRMDRALIRELNKMPMPVSSKAVSECVRGNHYEV